jgi:hypothetical protein
VRAFARDCLAGRAPQDDFDSLAVRIADFQARFQPGLARLSSRHRGGRGAASIAAVPVDVFRWMRVAVHRASEDVARFSTSGTTSDAPGVHPFRTLETYRTLALAWGAQALEPRGSPRRTVVALAPRPEPEPASSLGFMMRAFMEAWDGRGLDAGGAAGVDPRGADRGRLAREAIDVEGLERAVDVARGRGEPLVVLATSFALVFLLDALSGRRVALPDDSVVMMTGGFKGRTRELDADALVSSVADALGLAPERIVGEYGMTELSSQLYEGTLLGAGLSGARGVYLEPPWLRVVPVDPITLRPVHDGEPGLARFVDLANVDSAVAIVTQDRVRRSRGGIRGLPRVLPSG